jgi:hypothetical protein
MTAEPAAPRLRHEFKFALAPAAGGELERWLQTCGLALRAAHPSRLVHNVYFDTLEGHALADKFAGLSLRAKVRYRWYGDSDVPDVGQLEVKRRTNGLGCKETCAVAVELPAGSRAAFVRALRAAVPARARAWLDVYPEPVLANCYRRAYFVSGDGRVRVTVDRALTVWDQRGRFLHTGRGIPIPGLVLELKLPPELRAHVVAEVRSLGFVASACSKYELGMRAVSG